MLNESCGTISCMTSDVFKMQKENSAPSKRANRAVTPCQHLVAIPDNYAGLQLDRSMHGTVEDPVWNGEMAKSYPFQLDEFQKKAVACIVRSTLLNYLSMFLGALNHSCYFVLLCRREMSQCLWQLIHQLEKLL